jgi:hypothetical protein
MATPDLARFSRILESARTRKASSEGDTLVVQAHLAQMRLFMLRQGVEFYPQQDSFGARRQFVQRVCEYNQLPSRLEGVIDNFLIDGKGLFFFRPSKDLYRIHYFRPDQYRVYRDEEGDIAELCLIYSFRVRPPKGFGSGLTASSSSMSRFGDLAGTSNEVRWIRIRVFKDRVEQEISQEQPSFDSLGQRPAVTAVNTLGFIPAVEVFNGRSLVEGEGFPEFDWMAGHVMELDRMNRSIKANLHFFGNPTLVSSRPKHDLMEPDEDGNTTQRATVSSNSGFRSMGQASTRVSESNYSGGGVRVPRVIANVEAADRVNYIVPDAVGGDLTAYAAMYQETIRTALGGVDDLSINSGATAYEVRTIHGRVSATAKRKCRDLFEYGLCMLLQLMVAYEESLFKESFARAIGLQKPEPPLEEQLPPDQIQKIRAAYQEELGKWNNRLGQAMGQAKESGQFPPDLVGLLPDGDTSILWRHQGEVFEDDKQATLQASIVCRNLQELGVDSLEALAWLFPTKTTEERAAMLGGFPFRATEATQRSIGLFIDTVRAMFQTPHPQEPDMPLAADPNLDVVPFIYRALQHLRTELNYGGRYSDIDATIGVPNALDDGDRLRASRGLPTAADRRTAERRARLAELASMAAGTSGSPTGTLPLGSGVQPSGPRPALADVPAFGAGGVLDYDPIAPQPGTGGQLGFGSTQPLPGGPGDADLAALTNAGLLPDLGASGGPATSGAPVRRTARTRRGR